MPRPFKQLLFQRLRHEFGLGKALANARRDTDDLERSLAAIDAIAARLTARTTAATTAARAA